MLRSQEISLHFIDDLGISETVNDRLFGWISFEAIGETRIKIDMISGKRLYPELTYLPNDVFDREISIIDDSTSTFLRHVGRGLALGTAIGALLKIEDIIRNKDPEGDHES